MTPETAWAEAMRYENRADPLRFFDELRKTPVARVGEDLYVVTGYWELHSCSTTPGSVPTRSEVRCYPDSRARQRPAPTTSRCTRRS